MARNATRPQHRAILLAFAVIALHFLLKPLAAVFFGTGQTAATYSGSVYALVSQASTGLLLVAAGLLLLLTVFHRSMEVSQSMSETDPLSGLLNRRGFERAAQQALARAERHGLPLTAIAFDLDHFKRINDTHGHAVGDAVIVHFAKLLGHAAPEGAVLGRMGGEEFALLLEHANVEAARLQAETVRLAAAAGAEGLPAYTVSAGVARWRRGEGLGDLMRKADQALYNAKSGGRDRTCAFAYVEVPELDYHQDRHPARA